MNFLFRKPDKATTEIFEVATANEPIAVSLRRDRRARNFTLRIKGPARAPVLTMPVRGSVRQARAFLDRHSGWLLRQMEKLPVATPIEDGAIIPLRGVPHRIRHAAEARGTVTIVAGFSVAEVVVAGRPEHLRRRVIDFLKREARRDLESAVAKHAAALGVRPTALRLRDTTSRWGSCAAGGELSFSWRLVLAPPFVLDYLAAHEVAHLREMNHSRRFWKLVEMLFPETPKARAWLLAEGAGLHAIGA